MVNVSSQMATFEAVRAVAMTARIISNPVASPRAWTIRRWLCPPSRVNARAPFTRSNFVPQRTSCSICAGASWTTISTTARSHSPSPATSVSSTWLSKWSSGERTPAIPPWAYELLLSVTRSFVTTSTDRSAGTSSAARRPAMPAPTTSTSVKRWNVAFASNETR